MRRTKSKKKIEITLRNKKWLNLIRTVHTNEAQRACSALCFICCFFSSFTFLSHRCRLFGLAQLIIFFSIICHLSLFFFFVEQNGIVNVGTAETVSQTKEKNWKKEKKTRRSKKKRKKESIWLFVNAIRIYFLCHIVIYFCIQHSLYNLVYFSLSLFAPFVCCLCSIGWHKKFWWRNKTIVSIESDCWRH